MTTVISGSSPSITFSDATTQTTAFTTPVSIANGGTGSSTLAGANIATTNSSTQSVTSINTFGFKNRIINGGMTIDQRYAGSAYSPANGFSVDRWTSGYYGPAGGTYSAQQVVDAPANFYNSLKITVTATPSNNTDAFFQLYQPIEANNVADFGLGTANAKSFTLSFWVKSSLTGTFCVAFGNNTSPAYYYISTYTINTADTWEQKTITVTAPTSGTWGTTNGQGLAVFFDLGCGTAEEAPSANTWYSSNYRRISGAVRLINTNGATLFVTGVQLEVGSQATSFDYRDYGRELILCQRYYQTLGYQLVGRVESTTIVTMVATLQVAMRTSPTSTVIGTPNVVVPGVGAAAVTGIASNTPSTNGMYISFYASGLIAGSVVLGSPPIIIGTSAEL